MPVFYPIVKKQHGFSLVEMAIVLVIVGLIIGTLFAPLAAQRSIKDLTETRSSLSVIKEAIYGFAVLNGRLPCPTFQADPSNANYGLEDCTITTEGYLPWKTLGVPEGDAWSTHRTLASDPWNGYWRYMPDSKYIASALFSSNILASALSSPFDGLYVQDSNSNQLTSTANGTEKPIAIIYSTGKDLVANGQNAIVDTKYESNENSPVFDDMLIWITRPVLVNRMVSAGKLP